MQEPLNPLPEGGDTGETGTSDLRAVLLPLVRAVHESVEPDEDIAEAIASAVERAGWRRVTEDPAEVEDCGHPHCVSLDQIRECQRRSAVLRRGAQ